MATDVSIIFSSAAGPAGSPPPAFVFNRAADTTDLVYAVEVANDLTGTWTQIFSAPGVSVAGQVAVPDPQAYSANQHRFLRLRVTSP